MQTSASTLSTGSSSESWLLHLFFVRSDQGSLFYFGGFLNVTDNKVVIALFTFTYYHNTQISAWDVRGQAQCLPYLMRFKSRFSSSKKSAFPPGCISSYRMVLVIPPANPVLLCRKKY